MLERGVGGGVAIQAKNRNPSIRVQRPSCLDLGESRTNCEVWTFYQLNQRMTKIEQKRKKPEPTGQIVLVPTPPPTRWLEEIIFPLEMDRVRGL